MNAQESISGDGHVVEHQRLVRGYTVPVREWVRAA